MEAGPIPDAGGNGDDRFRRKAAYHTGQRAFHPRRHDENIRPANFLRMSEKAMDPRHTHIVASIHGVPHKLRRQCRFSRHRDIAGPRRQNEDAPRLIHRRDRAPKVSDTGYFIVNSLRQSRLHHRRLLWRYPRCHDAPLGSGRESR